MIGLTADKLLLIAVLVGFLFGPERLPGIAAWLGSSVRSFRQHMTNAEERMRGELGVDIDIHEWKKLDPRQYDPRAIIRGALAAETTTVDSPSISGIAPATDDALPDPMASADPMKSNDETGDTVSIVHAEQQFRRRSDGHLERIPEAEPHLVTLDAR